MNPGASWIANGEHWSLGGQQAKFALRSQGDDWYEAHGAEPTTHILKPGVLGLRSQALIEHVSMRALELLGLRVAKSSFEIFDGEPAIVVERYDRLWQGDTLYRVHQEDLCQATSTLPANKYEVTAKDVVSTMRLGGANEGEIGRFVQAVIANWLIGAPDAHAKNYSLLLTPETVQLAPLYDVATGFGQATAYDKMAMKIGGAEGFRQVERRHLRAFASDLALEADEVLIAAVQFARVIPLAFAQAISEPDIGVAERQHLGQISETIALHCASVLHRLTSDS